MRTHFDAHHNFAKRDLRGCNIEVLPFIRAFPPQRRRRWGFDGYGKGWTVHFGWLFWTVIIHFYPEERPATRRAA
jgi:hypothetical protein